jgi:hypothetical protein
MSSYGGDHDLIIRRGHLRLGDRLVRPASQGGPLTDFFAETRLRNVVPAEPIVRDEVTFKRNELEIAMPHSSRNVFTSRTGPAALHSGSGG